MVFRSMVLGMAVASGSGNQGAAPPVDPIAQVRELLGKLDGVELIHAVKRPDGSLQVRIRRKQGSAVPLIWRDGMQRASYTYWGSDLSFTLSQTERGIKLDGLQNVVTPVSGPFRTRNSYVKSVALEVDGHGVPYYRSTNVFWGRLGRDHWRENILTEWNLPTDDLLKQLRQNPGAMTELKDMLAKVQAFGQVKIIRTADGKLDVRIANNPVNQIAVKRQVGLQMVESIEVGKTLSFGVSDSGQTIKFENIKDVKINSVVFGQKITVDLKSLVLSREKDGSVFAKAAVTNPRAEGKTMIVPVSLKDLPFDLGKITQPTAR